MEKELHKNLPTTEQVDYAINSDRKYTKTQNHLHRVRISIQNTLGLKLYQRIYISKPAGRLLTRAFGVFGTIDMSFTCFF